MHELGIAQSVLETVQAECGKRKGATPVKIGLRIGELSAIDPDALRFSFEALTRETELDGLELEIEMRPRRHRCLECATVFNVKDFVFECPRCGASHSQCISGEELELSYLEL